MTHSISPKSFRDAISWKKALLLAGTLSVLTAIGLLSSFHVLHSVGSLSDRAIFIGSSFGVMVALGAAVASYSLNPKSKKSLPKEEEIIPTKEEEIQASLRQQTLDYWVEETQPGPQFRMVLHGIFPKGESPLEKPDPHHILDSIQDLEWTVAITYRGTLYLNRPERVTINGTPVDKREIEITEDCILNLSEESKPISLVCPPWDKHK